MFYSLETRAGLSEPLALSTRNGPGTTSKQVKIGRKRIGLTLLEKGTRLRTYHEQITCREMVMSVTREAFIALKQSIEKIGRDGARYFGGVERDRVPFQIPELDQVLGGGLMYGATHDVMAVTPRDLSAASGFALGLVGLLSPRNAPWVWIRQDMAGRELGEPYGPGLASYGLNPAKLLLVQVPNAKEALRAAEESLRCQALSVVLLEPWGDPKQLDLTATRRLSLAAEASGVTLITLRSGGHSPLGSCRTRWEISASPSRSKTDFELGLPAFSIRLALNRQTGAGGPGGTWIMEWNHDKRLFRQANSCLGLSPSGDRSAPETPPTPTLQRAS